MPGPTTAALERDIVALNHRIAAIERDIHELRHADTSHDQKDREEFELDRERIAAIDKSVEEAKRIIGDISRDVQDVENKVELLSAANATDRPWVDIWKDLLKNVIYMVLGAGALAALVRWFVGQ